MGFDTGNRLCGAALSSKGGRVKKACSPNWLGGRAQLNEDFYQRVIRKGCGAGVTYLHCAHKRYQLARKMFYITYYIDVHKHKIRPVASQKGKRALWSRSPSVTRYNGRGCYDCACEQMPGIARVALCLLARWSSG